VFVTRRIRDAQPGAIHHVVNRGNRRAVIFHKDGDYDAFVEVLREACARFGMRLLAFAVMPNHWHLVVWPAPDVSLSAFMQWLTTTHVRRYHAHYEIVGTGHLYQDRYRNAICENERRVLATIRYVEANALAANLVESARDWRWSSLWLRANGDEGRLLSECPIALPANWPTYVDVTTKRTEPAESRAPADRG
jgi:putative transposase